MARLISSKTPAARPFEDYNSFFHPNVCHVCKTTRGLTECPSCRMISYCSEEHRMLHRAQHNEICQAILTCSTHWNIQNSGGKTLEEWTGFKEMNMRCVMYSLNRELEPHERQMFLFARSCIVCRAQDDEAAPCADCFSVNTCANHRSHARAHSCDELLLCLSLHVEAVKQNNRDNKVPPKYLSFDKNAVRDMPSFVRGCIQSERKTTSWTLNDYIHTDDFSGPLTLTYGIKWLHRQQVTGARLVVHVIAGNFADTRGLSAWEVLLHALPLHTKLVIVIMGSALPCKSLVWKCCSACRENSKELQFEYRRMVCHKHADCVFHETPDVTVGFNVDLGSNKICPESMKTLWRQSRLLILTAKSEGKADDNIKWLRKISGLHVAPLVNEKNRFASLRPHRDHESDSVFYPNQHITIYRNLKNISSSVQTDGSHRE